MNIRVTRTVSQGAGESHTQSAEIDIDFERLSIGSELECIGLIASELMLAICGNEKPRWDTDCDLCGKPCDDCKCYGS